MVWEDLGSSAYLPREMLTRDLQWMVGVLLYIPGFDQLLASPQALRGFEHVTLVLLVSAAVGLFTRWTLPAAVLCYAVMGSILRSYDHIFHQGIVPLYALALLAFAPCADALSVDRWLRARRGLPVPPAREPSFRYGMGRYLVWLAIALPYVMAGLSKVRNAGPWWWEAGQMRQMVYAMAAEPTHFGFQGWRLFAGAPDWVWALLGLGALGGELLFGLVLVSRMARRFLPAFIASMHVGILFIQNIFFPDLLAIQAVFYNWRAPLDRVRGRMRAAPPEHPAERRGFSRPERRLVVVAVAFTLVSYANWAARTEAFPFTAWQMFSGRATPGPVEHVRPMVVYQDGTRERARFERWIWAVADGRFRWLLTNWERRPERIAHLRRFLDACTLLANRGAPPGRRVAYFEIEVWEWDYLRHPLGPEHATLRRVVRHPER